MQVTGERAIRRLRNLMCAACEGPFIAACSFDWIGFAVVPEIVTWPDDALHLGYNSFNICSMYFKTVLSFYPLGKILGSKFNVSNFQ